MIERKQFPDVTAGLRSRLLYAASEHGGTRQPRQEGVHDDHQPCALRELLEGVQVRLLAAVTPGDQMI